MKREFKVIAILAGISLILGGCSKIKAQSPSEEFDIIDKAAACEEIKAESTISEEIKLNGFTEKESKNGDELAITERIEGRKESDDIAEENGEENHPYIELGDTMEIPLEVGARVIVEYPDGNVYEFFGEEFDIANNRITVFFDKEGF